MSINLISAKAREQSVVSEMIRHYCGRVHRGSVMCDECQALQAYATAKIESCRSGENKKACLHCQRTCMTDANRLKLKHVMNWSEDRIGWRRPALMLRYRWLKSRQPVLISPDPPTAMARD